VKRALLIGSQTGGLSGVHADVRLVDEALTRLGFEIRPAIEDAATAEGIRGRYRELIEDTGSDDVAVVYYSGHGARQPNPLWGTDRTLPRWLQYVVPTDFADRSGNQVRCILAEELSLLQQELTAKSRNVTVILDCCHSARMSRDPTLLPKANEHLTTPDADLVQRWRRLYPAARETDDNPDAVRVVACGPDQVAYESWNPTLASRHGALTSALAGVLTHTDAASWTWLDAIEILRSEMPGGSFQRPTVEGPADRRIFSLSRRGGSGVLPVRMADGVAMLPDAAIFGVAVGDTYALVGPDGDAAAPVTTATVQRLVGGCAVLHLDGIAVAELPALTTAWPRSVAFGRRPVAVRGPADAERAGLLAELERSIRIRLADDADTLLATIRLDEDGVQVLDAGGQPLYTTPLTGTERVRAAVTDVDRLALAEHIRSFPNGAGEAELPCDVTVTLFRVLSDGSEIAVRPGEHLFTGDRLQVRAMTAAPRRYVSVFDIGIAGAVTQLSTAEPDGVTLTAHVPYDLGRDWRGGGIFLNWPRRIPVDTPRAESLLVIITDAKVDRLADLGQRGVSRGRNDSTSALARLISNLSVGRRDMVPVENSPIRHRVQRFDFMLHPTTRPADGEPTFEIDERPDPSFRLVVPRAASAVPRRLAIRLADLTVHSNRSFLSSRVRVDTMVISAVPKDSGKQFHAQTMRFPRVHDGDRLPIDNALLYEGPVDRFVDIALWVAKDDRRDLDLAELIAAQANSEEVAEAISTIAVLAVAQPSAALVAGSAGAVALLVRTAAHIIDQLRGSSIGVYRTSLLPHEGFGVNGAGNGIGRRPVDGLIHAQDISFALEFVDQDRT
jgi:hypothetical protein